MHSIAKQQSSNKIFYQMGRACLYSGAVTERLCIADATLLAQKSSDSTIALLAQLDSAGSIIGTRAPRISQLFTPYGASAPGSLVTIPAFSGQPFDRASNTYPLGNGRRFYSPSIRFLHRVLDSAVRMVFNMSTPTLFQLVASDATATLQQATRQVETGWNMLPRPVQIAVSAAVAIPAVTTVGLTAVALGRTGTVIVPSLQQSAGLLMGMGEVDERLRLALDIRRF